MKTYKALGGETIRNASIMATAKALECRESVTFDFNGITMVTDGDREISEMVEFYHNEIKKQADAYKASPEGIAAAAKRSEQISLKQTKCETLLGGLEEAVTGPMPELMNWVSEFAEVADDVAVQVDYKQVIEKFEAAGFKANECVGSEQSEYDKREIMGRYIVGQALDCMAKGMPPHPVTRSFVEKFHKLLA